MASQSQRGYQHGASRESASGRTNLGRGASSGGRDRQGAHLLSPGSASGFSGNAHAGAPGQPLGSASPASQYTPNLVLTKAEYQSEEEEDLSSSSEDEEESMEGTEDYKSGAERLAEKCKMKRFRLTHAQTRYLMSEFARQAHPNAAQRERLSRDIPGLSPRQVQVWFQNRRAKLKRLTTDDQERMMRSRAVPEEFEFTQTLQPSLRDARSPYESIPSLHNLSLTGGSTQQRPAAMSSVYTNFPPGTGSAVGSGNLSPVSSTNEGLQYSGVQYSENLSPLSANPHLASPFSRSSSLSAPSQAQQCQAEPSRQRSATFVQPSPAYAGDLGTYRDCGPQSAPHTPYPPQIPPQHAATFPQGLEIPQRVSPLHSSQLVPYNQRQSTYPQPAVAAGYYGPPYAPQNVEVSGWQGGQLAPKGVRYDPSSPQPGAFQPLPIRQPHSLSNPSPDSRIYDQLSGYRYAGSPRFLTEPDRQSSFPSSDIPPAGSGAHGGSDASRRRGGTYPGYWPNQR